MSSALVGTLTSLVVVALVVVRESKPKRATNRTWWLVPAVLVFLAVSHPGRSGGFIDAQHPLASALLLAFGLVTGVLVGVGWGCTGRMWTEPDGSVWVRGTKKTAVVWTGGIALRIGLMGLGALIGVQRTDGPLLLALALSLLVRSAIRARRARTLLPTRAQAVEYGGDASAASRKDRV